MSATPNTGLTAPRIRASMRAWLRRRMVLRAGGKRANPLYRLTQAISRAPGAGRLRICTPSLNPLTIFMSSGPKRFSSLGLGLAGGGGGSPGCILNGQFCDVPKGRYA